MRSVRPMLYFVRHGETDWNADGRLQGRRDVALNEAGRAQADALGRRLAGLVRACSRLDYVASPLVRTRETMERLRTATGLPGPGYRVDARLQERSFGAWEGLTRQTVRIRDESDWAARKRGRWDHAPPGGESYATLSRRAVPAIAEVARDAVVVAHVGIARVLLAALLRRPARGGVPSRRSAGPDPVDRGRPLRLVLTGRQTIRCVAHAEPTRCQAVDAETRRFGRGRASDNSAGRSAGTIAHVSYRTPREESKGGALQMSVIEDLGVRPDETRPVEQGAILYGAVDGSLCRDEVLAEIFAVAVRSRPDHPAMIFGAERLTYGDVDARTDAIARGLADRGIGPGDVVGLWMPRGAELLISQIAITKSGAAWLPFDADAPTDRIAVCLGDAQAKGLLTSEALAGKAGEAGVAVLTPQALARDTNGAAVDARASGLTPDHPAYMIYTSGSTGTPKGIVITHRNICHFLRSANAVYGLRSDDVVFQGASVAFDLSMEEIWVPYLVGATLFVASPATMGDAERLPDLLTEAGITVLDTVPTLLSLLTKDVPSLRLILLGGEALPPPLLGWDEAGPAHLQHLRPDRGDGRRHRRRGPGGRARDHRAPDPELHLLHRRRAAQPAPPGAQGELLIGGPGVAPGYLKRPDADLREVHRQPVPERRPRPGPVPLGRRGQPRRGRQHRLPRPHRRPGQDPRLPGRARRDRGQARRTCRASRRRPWCCARTTASTGSSPSWCRSAARRSTGRPCAPTCASSCRPT